MPLVVTRSRSPSWSKSAQAMPKARNISEGSAMRATERLSTKAPPPRFL